MVGPSLADVVSRKAGSVPGYHYSASEQASGLTWDAVTLDHYLTNPRALAPGTKMSVSGIADPRQRQDLIAYLSTLH